MMDAFSQSRPVISMAKNERTTKIGAAIRTARKRRGMVQRDISERLDVTVASVGQWEAGTNGPSADNLFRTAEVLRVDPVALSRGELVYLGEEPLADAEVISGFAPAPTGPMDVEIRGVSYGGDDGDFTFNGEVAGYVRRPPGIAHMKNVFALHVLSDSMVPRYDPGEVIYCGGREPVPGDHVVIETFPDREGEAGKAFVKKLIKRTGTEIIAEQYNPAQELKFPKTSVQRIWRVIPLKELIGF